MCGIYGMVCLGETPRAGARSIEKMGPTLRHRGPDSSRVLTGKRVLMGCERLRIVDLHERADQPFHDPSGRYWIACNGEIYNAGALRSRYPRYPFASNSDVETIVPLFLDRGEATAEDLDGMFALAIWDDASRTLLLSRDRAGEKPLFYTRVGDEVWFASEVQALLVNPRVPRELDQEAVADYLAFGYIPSPRTAFQGIRKVPAGCTVRFNDQADTTRRYWHPDRIAAEQARHDGSAEELSSLLESAVRKQMSGDVPIGVFVSGGLDSALIATIAAQECASRLHSYVARFANAGFDESPWAASCARRAGTIHHEVLIDEPALFEAFGAVSDRLAEPLADPAILPTYLIAKEARKDVTVVLGGEGADELFGGYPSYLGHQLTGSFQRLPRILQACIRTGVGRLRPSQGRVPIEFLLKRFVANADAPWVERHAAWIGVDARPFSRNGLSGTSVSASGFSAGGFSAGGHSGNGAQHDRDLGGEMSRMQSLAAQRCMIEYLADAERAMLFDYLTYLPDDLLVKTDRATMLHSIEARSPFLDRDLTRFALSLPLRSRVRGLTTKHLLKQAARSWLPKKSIVRRKRGLSVPTAAWINGGLRAEVDRLLDPARLERQELFDSQAVHQALASHRAGTANCCRPLWSMIFLQRWLDRWLPERADPRGA